MTALGDASATAPACSGGSLAADQAAWFEQLDDALLLHTLSMLEGAERPELRLVCKRWRDLIDGAVSPGFAIHAASHLGGTPTRPPIYPGHLEFQVAAANLLARRAQCLEQLRLDFDAYGCVFAARLLEQQPLPRLRRVALQNAEAQHVGLLRALPRLEDVCLSRQINGIVRLGPAAETLVAQLAGLPLAHLSLAGYRMLPGVVASVADALPGLRHLSLEVERIEGQQGRLDLAALPRLAQLESWRLRLPGAPASAPEPAVAPLSPGAAALHRLARVALAHVRPRRGQEEAFWSSLALLPALEELDYEEAGHAARQPPPQLLTLSTLTSLAIKIDGHVYSEDPPSSTWTQLPELPAGGLPRLAALRLECVGLLALPASWCRLPLERLHVSGLASERSVYSLRLPDELARLAGSLRRLELPACGLASLVEEAAQLTRLTALDLRHNAVVRLPMLSRLTALEELELFGCPATNAATALQGCRALRRLGLGTRFHALCRRHSLDGGAACGAAYEDVEAGRWEAHYLDSVRSALPWVAHVGAAHAAECG